MRAEESRPLEGGGEGRKEVFFLLIPTPPPPPPPSDFHIPFQPFLSPAANLLHLLLRRETRAEKNENPFRFLGPLDYIACPSKM